MAASLNGRVDRLAAQQGPCCPNCGYPIPEAGPPPRWGEDPQHDEAVQAAERAYIAALEAQQR